MIATVRLRFWNRRSSTSGWMLRLASAHGTNAAIRTAPRIIGTSTLGAIAVPSSGMELTPKRNAARPGESSSMPSQSKVSDGSTSSLGSTIQA